MEIVAVVAVIVVLIVVAYLWTAARDAAKTHVMRAIFRGTHQRGRDAVERITVGDLHLAPNEAAQAIIDATGALDVGHVTDLYVKHRGESHLVLARRALVGDSFQYQVDITPTEPGSHVVGTVAEWSEADGLVSDFEEMAHVHDAIERLTRTDTTSGSI